MKSITRVILAIAILSIAFTALPRPSHARGHDGFYFGVGPMTIPMFTTEHRLTAPGGQSDRISFWPGLGGYLLFGYDFPGGKWGLQMPFEYQYFRLNRQEWTHQFGSTFEAVMRIAQWANGLEFHLIYGLGWTYLLEGQISNRTRAAGITAEVGPGFSWFFARGDTRAALSLEFPLRYIYFFGDNLSRGGTSVLAIPVRLGVTISF